MWASSKILCAPGPYNFWLESALPMPPLFTETIPSGSTYSTPQIDQITPSMSSPSRRRELWGLRDPSPNIKEAFNVLDKDGDGRIAFNDLQDFLNTHKQTYLSREEIESMISVADKNHNGSVEFEEFEGLMMALMMMEHKNEGNNALEEAFRVMDKDGDGVVSVGDLKSFVGDAMHSVNDEDVVEMIEAAGACAQSGICYKDFLALMMTMINGSQ